MLRLMTALLFTVGTESERTDTEELVGRAASQCSAPPDLLPSEARALLQPSTPPPRPNRPEPTYKSPSSPTAGHQDEKQPRLRFEVVISTDEAKLGSYIRPRGAHLSTNPASHEWAIESGDRNETDLIVT